MSGSVYGIDVGTSNSAIVVRRPDGTEVRVTDPAAVRGGWTVPSAVALGRDGSIVVGWAAERAKLARPSSYRSEFKREFGDPTPARLGERQLAAHDLVTEVLRFLRDQARAQVPGDPDHVVIAVPASWEQGNRDLMRSSAAHAGFDPRTVTLVDEPVAAAHSSDTDGTILVYDLGGGTFDCAVARVGAEGMEVLGPPGGLGDVGGGAFDRAVLAELRRRFPAEFAELLGGDATDPSVLRRRLQLRTSCEELKVALSVTASAEAFLTELVPPAETTLTRDELAALLDPMLRRTLAECDDLLERVGLGWTDVDRIVPVGGSARLPLVGEMLAKHAGRPVVVVDDPELAVAVGAARLSAPSAPQPQHVVPRAASSATLWPLEDTTEPDLRRLNVLLLGATGSGKTTWLSAARGVLTVPETAAAGSDEHEHRLVLAEDVPDPRWDEHWRRLVRDGRFPPCTARPGEHHRFVLGTRARPAARVQVFDPNGGLLTDRQNVPGADRLWSRIGDCDSVVVAVDGAQIGGRLAGEITEKDVQRRLKISRMTHFLQPAVDARRDRGLPAPSLVLLITKTDVIMEKNGELGPAARQAVEYLDRLVPIAYEPGLTTFVCFVQVGRFGSSHGEPIHHDQIDPIGVHRPLAFALMQAIVDERPATIDHAEDGLLSHLTDELRGHFILVDGKRVR